MPEVRHRPGRAIVLSLVALAGCFSEAPAIPDSMATSVEEIADRVGPGPSDRQYRLPRLCRNHRYTSPVRPPGRPVYLVTLGTERSPFSIRFEIMASAEEARDFATQSRDAAAACAGRLDDVTSASGLVATDTEVEPFSAAGWTGVVAVTKGVWGNDEGPQRYPVTEVATVAARGFLLADLHWIIKGSDRGSAAAHVVDPGWEAEGRKKVQEALRQVGGDPALDPPTTPELTAFTFRAALALPVPASYAAGTRAGFDLGYYAGTPCSEGEPRPHTRLPYEMAYVERFLAGNDAYVREFVAVVPEESEAGRYERDWLEESRFNGNRLPVDCFSYGHPPHLPLVGPTKIPYAEETLKIGSWTGTLASAAARLAGAPLITTLPNSQAWVSAVVREGKRVASLVLFTTAGPDLGASLADKRAQVAVVMRSMVGEAEPPASRS